MIALGAHIQESYRLFEAKDAYSLIGVPRPRNADKEECKTRSYLTVSFSSIALVANEAISFSSVYVS